METNCITKVARQSLSSKQNKLILLNWVRKLELEEKFPVPIYDVFDKFSTIDIKSVILPQNKCAPWNPNFPSSKKEIFTRVMLNINDTQDDIWFNEENVYFD